MKGCSELVGPGPNGRNVGKLLRKNMRKPHFRGREGRKVTNRPRAVGVPVSFAYLALRCRRQSGRETGITERERKGDMTQGHMDRSGGGGVSWCASLCVDRFFISSRIGCDLHDRRRLRTCRWRQKTRERRTNEGERNL
jgi:hypothetical protein